MLKIFSKEIQRVSAHFPTLQSVRREIAKRWKDVRRTVGALKIFRKRFSVFKKRQLAARNDSTILRKMFALRVLSVLL